MVACLTQLGLRVYGFLIIVLKRVPAFSIKALQTLDRVYNPSPLMELGRASYTSQTLLL